MGVRETTVSCLPVTTPPPIDAEPPEHPEAEPAQPAAAEPAGAPVLPGGFSIDKLLAGIDWSPHLESLGQRKQGHLVRHLPLAWIAATGWDPLTGLELDPELGEVAPQWPEGTFDAVICSQTCDLGGGPPGDQHPMFLVAPLVHESGLGSNARRTFAAAGKLGYLIPVLPADPDLLGALVAAGEENAQRRAEKTGELRPFELTTVRDTPKGHRWYADLRLLVPVSKNVLLSRDPIDGFLTEAESLGFAETMAQKFRRAALHEALSEQLPAALEAFIRGNNPNSQCFAKVEQVRLDIREGDRLYPKRAQLVVLSTRGDLTDEEIAVWEKFNPKAKEVLAAAGIDSAPIVHYDVNNLDAPSYRIMAPVRCPLLGHTRWP